MLGTIRQTQKELRQVKREINNDLKTCRASYREKSANVSVGGWTLLMSRGRERQVLADKKRQLNSELDDILKPYDTLKIIIDRFIIQCDGAKIQIQDWLENQE